MRTRALSGETIKLPLGERRGVRICVCREWVRLWVGGWRGGVGRGREIRVGVRGPSEAKNVCV